MAIAILRGTDSASTVEFMTDDDGNRMVFDTWDEAGKWLDDNAEMGPTYQKWPDCNHPED
jgi:hypothetical protein